VLTTQERNTSEEGYVDEHGNVVIEKRTTRTVTTTRTLMEDDEPSLETQQIVSTTESGGEIGRSESPGSSDKD